MKIIVISDSHGNIANLKNVLGFAKKINSEALIHCGDWNSVKAIETILESGIPLYTVLGNADIDPEIKTLLSKKAKMFSDTYLEVEIDEKKVGVVHKIKDAVFSNQDLLFYGHTHRQFDSYSGGVRIINPGALENNIEFAIYDTKSNKIEFLHG